MATPDPAAQCDLAQLDGLVRWRVRDQWVPAMPGDLPERVARQLSGIRQAVQAAASSIKVKKMTNGSSDHASGRRLELTNGVMLWAAVWPGMWGRMGNSPAWVTIRAGGLETPATVYERLAPLRDLGGPGVFPSGTRWAVPLAIPHGVEIGAVSAAVKSQIERVIGLVDDSFRPEPVGPALPDAVDVTTHEDASLLDD